MTPGFGSRRRNQVEMAIRRLRRLVTARNFLSTDRSSNGLLTSHDTPDTP
jgi:hypothetical protein